MYSCLSKECVYMKGEGMTSYLLSRTEYYKNK